MTGQDWFSDLTERVADLGRALTMVTGDDTYLTVMRNGPAAAIREAPHLNESIEHMESQLMRMKPEHLNGALAVVVMHYDAIVRAADACWVPKGDIIKAVIAQRTVIGLNRLREQLFLWRDTGVRPGIATPYLRR